MNFVVAVIMLPMGIWMLINPDLFCRLEDYFRIKGERTYSDYALIGMRIRGFIVSVAGFILFFIRF